VIRRPNITWRKAILALLGLYAVLCLATWIALSHPDHGQISPTITVK
jgi:hypothetical protein